MDHTAYQAWSATMDATNRQAHQFKGRSYLATIIRFSTTNNSKVYLWSIFILTIGQKNWKHQGWDCLPWFHRNMLQYQKYHWLMISRINFQIAAADSQNSPALSASPPSPVHISEQCGGSMIKGCVGREVIAGFQQTVFECFQSMVKDIPPLQSPGSRSWCWKPVEWSFQRWTGQIISGGSGTGWSHKTAWCYYI